MSWVKLDDQFFSHPKVLRAGRDARDVFLVGLSYCANHLTDGHIPAGALPMLGALAMVDDVTAAAEKLVEVRLWEVEEDGYLVHDYLKYQPSGEEERHRREKNAERQARFQERKRAERNANNNGVSNASVTHAPSPSPSVISSPKSKRSIKGKDTSSLSATAAHTASPPRPINPLWDELVAQFYEPEGDMERGRFGKAVHHLKKLGATVEDVRRRCEHHRLGDYHWTLTPLALVGHWGELAQEQANETTHTTTGLSAAATGTYAGVAHARNGARPAPAHAAAAGVKAPNPFDVGPYADLVNRRRTPGEDRGDSGA